MIPSGSAICTVHLARVVCGEFDESVDVEFGVNPKRQSPEFTVGYWPRNPVQPDESTQAFLADRECFAKVMADGSADLFAKILHDRGQTILGQVLIAVDHNAYRLAELALLRRLLGAWK